MCVYVYMCICACFLKVTVFLSLVVSLWRFGYGADKVARADWPIGSMLSIDTM